MPHGDGFRLMSNRDERLSRATALPPRRTTLGHAEAVFPVDPQGGGTWIGANDAGLAMALLNREARAGIDPPAPRSRGLIIPALLAFDSLDDALSATGALDLQAFLPFRVVAAHEERVGIATWDGEALRVQHAALDGPLMFASSSLGDHLVEAPRLRLFNDLVVDSQSWLAGQFRFHGHQWPDRPEVSVRMERPGVRTVSISMVDVTSDALLFTYRTLPPSRVH